MTEPITLLAAAEPIPGDATLIERARQDSGAFGQLYQRYVQAVYRYLYSRIGSQPEAEDATAQTFLAVIEGLPRYRDDGHFAAWLFSIARFKAMDHFRKQRKQVSLEEAELVPLGTDLLQQVIRNERGAALAKLISALPDDERELIRLRYVADLGFADMARLLNRKEDAVKKSLYRLLDRLQSQLEDLHV